MKLSSRLSQSKSHDHYGPKVKDALKTFEDLFRTYYNTTKVDFKHSNAFRLDAVQAAWDALAKARKEETGTGFYLTKQEHQNANSR